MEYKFTELIQQAIVCMNDRILNAANEENRPLWDGFSGRWFNSISASPEWVAGKDGDREVVRRLVTFKHNNVIVALITLEGIYSLDVNGRRNWSAHWDVYLIEYALRYDLNKGTTGWTFHQSIPHNGATIEATMS